MPNLYLYIGGSFLGFSVVAMHMSLISSLDLIVVQYFSEHRSIVLSQLTQLLSLIGGMPFVLLLTGVWCLFCILKQQYKTALFIALGIIGCIVIGWSLKWMIDRPRPELMYALVKSYGPSFPSAHSAYAATLASIAKCLHRQTYFTVICIISCLIMGLSRVYAGVHFPTDVFAGWGVGLLWVSLLWQLMLRINQKSVRSV
ncbi:phosphatase PAP2 family protein [Acinetobacter sp. MD2]|uniref:phosphatase PAP2 family protein n=1 Tax=Acinetobacter sp. MD2 TaxID=2600066 RepID=UPI002D1F4A4A|nr:phosphatase PAP2 family protein [Acinetobacter sp. MD2]MEB3767592.1 phosphatase PAP2 family protein [Acinetobacter sp. MD2]